MILKYGRDRRTRNGFFIVVVGPDGSGKTTAARELIANHDGPTAYFHFMPPFRRPMIRIPPEYSVPPPSKGSLTGSKPVGLIRLGVSLIRFWAGYVMRIRPALARGTLVIGDRWAYGYVAQPYALKFYGPRWLAMLAVRALPQPDLVVNLVAPPEVIYARKKELPVGEIRSELTLWRSVPAKNRLDVDARLSPAEIAAGIRSGLRDLD